MSCVYINTQPLYKSRYTTCPLSQKILHASLQSKTTPRRWWTLLTSIPMDCIHLLLNDMQMVSNTMYLFNVQVLFFFLDLSERERERESKGSREGQRETQTPGWAGSQTPGSILGLRDHALVEGRCPTDWATQALHGLCLFNANISLCECTMGYLSMSY